MRARRAGAPYVGAVSGAVIVVAAFLPWYALTIGRPFSPASVSGWEATNLARVAVVMGVVVAVAAGAAALDERGSVPLERRLADALGWVVLVASAVAAVAVGYRLLVMPEPAEFFTRQIGLYLAAAATVGGILSGLALIAIRE